MNGAAVKAKNREIRKAFGAEAIAHLQAQDAKLEALEQQITQAFTTERQLRMEADSRQATELQCAIRAVDVVFGAFRSLPWYRRWAWVLGFGSGR